MSSAEQSALTKSSQAINNAELTFSDIERFAYAYLKGEDWEHALVNPLGTYLDGIDEDLEPLIEYRECGFHPIHIGDTLGENGRYRVIHKLGHGGSGTVWLCRDSLIPGYVAVKVMSGDISTENMPTRALEKLDRSAPGAEYINMPLDIFSVEGPNGTHQCIVLPVLGPCVSPSLWHTMKRDPGLVLRNMAYQVAMAMNFLHKNGICHGGGYSPITMSLEPHEN